jgi:peptidoglycan LD-endopeptidase LytH
MGSFNRRKRVFWILMGIVLILFLGMLIPQQLVMPVADATRNDYNPDSFWYYPWGKSVVHKGVDIFAKTGTPVVSSTRGVVIYVGSQSRGGNTVLILGPKWRLHYYAHLDEIKTKRLSLVSSSCLIGTVGASGNAINTPPHLHYSVVTMVPYPWRIDNARQGWKKMFYLNPLDYLR